MNIYTIGFAKKTASEFFNTLKKYNIDKLIDIRLNNTSQLAAFTKQKDLEFFLKEICNIRYEHIPEFAPSQEILDGWKKKKISWDEYEQKFNTLLEKRGIVDKFIKQIGQDRVLFLCSEPSPKHCHRRLTAEAIANRLPNIDIIHL